MKLCSVCDKKIEGTWCKTCKRFVKTYDVSDRIHLNESHNPRNDADCTYHNPTTTRRTSTTQTTTSTRSTATTSSGTAKKSKAGKIVALIICIYVIFGVLGTVGPLIFNAISENWMEDTWVDEEEDDTVVRDWGDDDYEYDEEESFSDLDYDYDYDWNAPTVSQIMLETLTPVEEETVEDGEYTYNYSYYEPEEIKKLYVECDGDHFDMKASDFEDLLKSEFGGSENWDFNEEAYAQYNYKCQYEDYAWTYFETDLSYYVDETLAISIDCDTATREIHAIVVGADTEVTETEGFMEFYNELLQELDSEYSGTAADLSSAVEQAMEEAEGYQMLELSEAVDIYACRDDLGRLILVYYPTYEYE